jgi:hypothetical protein
MPNDEKWKSSPVITSDNATKDALNVKASEAFAKSTGRELHWYYATDMRKGREILDPDLKTHLIGLHSGQTSQRLGRIPLVLGMPVMLCQNFDVEAGVVNGCTGTLTNIRYRVDAEGNRHALSCVVKTTDTTGEALPHLPDKHVAVLEDTVDMSFVHPHSNKKCTIKRSQVPIVPAFAMTAHKAQGQTLSTAIVDLQSCRGTEAPYVMISRMTSLEGLFILRPFQIKKIQSRPSEDMRRETKRLELLNFHTIVQVGTEAEKQEAFNQIARLRNVQDEGDVEIDLANMEGTINDPNKRLQHLQSNILRLSEKIFTDTEHSNSSNRSRIKRRQLSPESDVDSPPHKRNKI